MAGPLTWPSWDDELESENMMAMHTSSLVRNIRRSEGFKRRLHVKLRDERRFSVVVTAIQRARDFETLKC